jgi:hypothetical protein
LRKLTIEAVDTRTSGCFECSIKGDEVQRFRRKMPDFLRQRTDWFCYG